MSDKTPPGRGGRREGVEVTDEQQELARRAVACKHWRWVRGCPIAPVEAPVDGEFAFALEHPSDGRPLHAFVTPHDGLGVLEIGRDLPDLTNPATLGCLLALVREAWGDGALGVCELYGLDGLRRWVVVQRDLMVPSRGSGPTEAHALVAALEAAPMDGGDS